MPSYIESCEVPKNSSAKSLTSTSRASSRYSLQRLQELSAPKDRHPRFMPDKPSPYWVDRIIDERPSYMTTPEELMEYYQRFHNSHSRLNLLAQPKPVFSRCGQTSGKYALKYECSERIRALAKPKPIISTTDFAPSISDESVRAPRSRGDLTRPPHHAKKPRHLEGNAGDTASRPDLSYSRPAILS